MTKTGNADLENFCISFNENGIVVHTLILFVHCPLKIVCLFFLTPLKIPFSRCQLSCQLSAIASRERLSRKKLVLRYNYMKIPWCTQKLK